ncbi:MAG: GNAT family N-acetyltransferase [Gammaproteobacteria bacterium]
MLAPIAQSDFNEILRINSAAQPGVVPLSLPELARIRSTATVFCALKEDGEARAYVIAYSSDCAYEGEEFLWLRKNVGEKFLYIDQIAVAVEARSAGIGSKVYEFVERFGVMNDFTSLTCEVNTEPPNLTSLQFHLHRGFSEVGKMKTRDGRGVCLLRKSLG